MCTVLYSNTAIEPEVFLKAKVFLLLEYSKYEYTRILNASNMIEVFMHCKIKNLIIFLFL